MAVRGQGEAAVVDLPGAGHPVGVHPLAALRWAAPVTVGQCPATAVPMAVALPMPRRGVTSAVIATGVARGMGAGIGRGMAIEPEIDPLTDSVIAPQIDLESALVIAPVPSTGIRTTAQGPDVFAIGTIVTAIAVALGMNGVSRPSAPAPATTRAAPSGRMQHRRLQQPLPQRTT